MILVYLALLMTVLIVNRTFFGLKIMPNDVFTAVWCIFAGLASLGVFGFYPTNDATNMMVFITVSVFNIVFIAAYSYNNRYSTLPERDTRSDVFFDSAHINLWIIVIVNVLCWAFSSLFLRNTISILLSQGFAALRAATFSMSSDTIGTTTSQQLIFVWAVQPAFIATMAVSAAALIFKFRYRFLYLAISVFDVVMYTLLFAGRGTIMKFISLILFSVIIAGGKKLLPMLAKHKGTAFLIIAALIAISMLTAERSFSGKSLIANYYAYLAGPFIYFQRFLEEYPLSDTPMLFGLATFGCIASVIAAFTKIFFGIEFWAAETVIPNITSNYLDVSPDMQMNSMTTMIYPFLRDFGYAGVVLGPAVYALFTVLVYRTFEKKRSLRSMCILVYVMHTLVFSVENYAFMKMESLSIILFIVLFTTGFEYRDGKIYLS